MKRSFDKMDEVHIIPDQVEIESPPCDGGCGLTRIECYILEKKCRDWICHMDGDAARCPGYVTRCPVGVIPDKCPHCGGSLLCQFI